MQSPVDVLVGYGGMNNCAGHQGCRSLVSDSCAHCVWAWGVTVGCQLLGLIVVLPAQSGSGGGLVLDGLACGNFLCESAWTKQSVVLW